MDVRRLHHITIAVRDVEQAQATFAALFGARVAAAAEDVVAFDARTLDATLAGTPLQFVAPATSESALARFIERKGEGVYSIALEVADLDAAVRELQERGIRVSDPVEAAAARSAFVTMAATHGVSVQLIEAAPNDDRSTPLETTDATPPNGPDPQIAARATPDEPSAQPPPLLDLTPDEWSDTD